jgi:hypothetical protein
MGPTATLRVKIVCRYCKRVIGLSEQQMDWPPDVPLPRLRVQQGEHSECRERAEREEEWTQCRS